MKNVAAVACTALAILGLAATLSAARLTAQTGEVLTNDSIVQMMAGKVPKSLILTKIQTTASAFDVTSDGLVGLAENKIPNDLIKAMIKASAGKESKEVLSNEAVVHMVTSQLPRDIVISKIQTTKTGFDLTATGLVSLNQSKVPEDVIKAMLAASSSGSASGGSAPAAAPAPSKSAAPSAGSSARGGQEGFASALKGSKVTLNRAVYTIHFTGDGTGGAARTYNEPVLVVTPSSALYRVSVRGQNLVDDDVTRLVTQVKAKVAGRGGAPEAAGAAGRANASAVELSTYKVGEELVVMDVVFKDTDVAITLSKPFAPKEMATGFTIRLDSKISSDLSEEAAIQKLLKSIVTQKK